MTTTKLFGHTFPKCSPNRNPLVGQRKKMSFLFFRNDWIKILAFFQMPFLRSLRFVITQNTRPKTMSTGATDKKTQKSIIELQSVTFCFQFTAKKKIKIKKRIITLQSPTSWTENIFVIKREKENRRKRTTKRMFRKQYIVQNDKCQIVNYIDAVTLQRTDESKKSQELIKLLV